MPCPRFIVQTLHEVQSPQSHLVPQAHRQQDSADSGLFGGRRNLEKWVAKVRKPRCAARGRAKLGRVGNRHVWAPPDLRHRVLEARSAAREGRPRHSLGKFHLTSDVFDPPRMTVPLKPSPFKVIQSRGPTTSQTRCSAGESLLSLLALNCPGHLRKPEGQPWAHRGGLKFWLIHRHRWARVGAASPASCPAHSGLTGT